MAKCRRRLLLVSKDFRFFTGFASALRVITNTTTLDSRRKFFLVSSTAVTVVVPCTGTLVKIVRGGNDR